MDRTLIRLGLVLPTNCPVRCKLFSCPVDRKETQMTLKDHLNTCRRMREHAEQRMELDPERGNYRTRLRNAKGAAKSIEKNGLGRAMSCYWRLWATSRRLAAGLTLFGAPESRQVPNLVSRSVNICLNHVLTRNRSRSRPRNRRATKRSCCFVTRERSTFGQTCSSSSRAVPPTSQRARYGRSKPTSSLMTARQFTVHGSRRDGSRLVCTLQHNNHPEQACPQKKNYYPRNGYDSLGLEPQTTPAGS